MPKKRRTNNGITVDGITYQRVSKEVIESRLIPKFLMERNSTLEVFAMPNRMKIENPLSIFLQTNIKGIEQFRIWATGSALRYCNTRNGMYLNFYVKM